MLRYATSILIALLATTATAVAQHPAACDSVVLVDHDLAANPSTFDHLADWIPAGSKIEQFAERAQPKNRNALARELVRSYPSRLRDRHIGGEVMFAVRVDPTGSVLDRRIVRSSGYPDLDRAAAPIVDRMRFEPMRSAAGCAAPVILQMPIVFKTIP